MANETTKRVGYRMFRKLTTERLTRLNAIINAVMDGSLLLGVRNYNNSYNSAIEHIKNYPLDYGLSQQGANRMTKAFENSNSVDAIIWLQKLLDRELVRQGVKN